MKSIFILLLAGLGILLFYYIFFVLRNKKDIIVFKIKVLMCASAEIIFSNIIFSISKNEFLAKIGYTMYFVGLDWILFFLLSFCHEYTRNRHSNRIGKIFLSAVLVLDTLSFIANLIFHHSFSLELNAVGLPWQVVPTPFYSIHLFIDYAIVLACFFYLGFATIMAPSLYKIKYASVFVFVLLIVVVNAIFMLKKSIFDFSVLFYAVFAIGIYHIAQIFIPQHLITLTMKSVADDLKNAMILFDIFGNCAYMNQSAKNIFTDEINATREIEKIVGKKDILNSPNFSLDFVRKINEKTHHFKLEFNRLENAKKRFIGSYFIFVDVTDELAKLEQEHYRASHDLLTGLYNKEYFYEQASERLQSDLENDYLMLCSNVVNFKLINDQYGTKRGDEVLKRIANEIKRLSASSDICGRLDADRFALLMPKKNFGEELFLIESLKSLNLLDDSGYSVICQMGVYAIEERNILVSVMCDRAFLALETIKKDISKRIAYYDDNLRNAVLLEQEIINAIPSALKNNEIQVFLQPQVDHNGTVLGAEALMRWFSKDRGNISTKDFIKTLENNGMIAIVDQYIWEVACRQLAKWKQSGHENLYISVNISPKDLYLIDICQVFSALIEKYEVQPKNLKLEITETAVMLDAERQSELIDKLRSKGFNVEMDDFGRGYSSLNTLKDFSLDELKIDLAFLHEAKNEEKGRKILEKMISMSKEIGIKVVTEGVETAEQVDFLHSVGSDIYQGYFFSEPLSISEFDEKYLKNS